MAGSLPRLKQLLMILPLPMRQQQSKLEKMLLRGKEEDFIDSLMLFTLF